jgi:hypothetical protein
MVEVSGESGKSARELLGLCGGVSFRSPLWSAHALEPRGGALQRRGVERVPKYERSAMECPTAEWSQLASARGGRSTRGKRALLWRDRSSCSS